MTFSSDGSPPTTFPSYRLDSHLVLNTLNQLGMKVYKLTNREIPLVGYLADYIIAEHESQTAIHRAHVGSDPAAKRAIVKIRAACSA